MLIGLCLAKGNFQFQTFFLLYFLFPFGQSSYIPSFQLTKYQTKLIYSTQVGKITCCLYPKLFTYPVLTRKVLNGKLHHIWSKLWQCKSFPQIFISNQYICIIIQIFTINIMNKIIPCFLKIFTEIVWNLFYSQTCWHSSCPNMLFYCGLDWSMKEDP